MDIFVHTQLKHTYYKNDIAHCKLTFNEIWQNYVHKILAQTARKEPNRNKII